MDVNLRPHLRYAVYLAKHKWFVFLACRRLGVPWLGVLHDLSKLDPREWRPYVERFYGRGQRPDGTIVTDKELPADLWLEYEGAWLIHERRNRHHPGWWVSHVNPHGWGTVNGEHTGNFTVLPMPRRYVAEMVADWDGARRAGAAGARATTREWYQDNGHRLPLHPRTTVLVDELLTELERGDR